MYLSLEFHVCAVERIITLKMPGLVADLASVQEDRRRKIRCLVVFRALAVLGVILFYFMRVLGRFFLKYMRMRRGKIKGF